MTWCEVQNALARTMRDHFEKWPDAWSIYCGRDKHPSWSELHFGEKLHVIFYYQEDLIGDVGEIDGQEFIGDRLALEYLLGHVRLHVAAGPGYHKRCGFCDSSWEAPAGNLIADYREAKAVTTSEVLDQLAQRIARAKSASIGMLVRAMYRRTSEGAEGAAC